MPVSWRIVPEPVAVLLPVLSVTLTVMLMCPIDGILLQLDEGAVQFTSLGMPRMTRSSLMT